ncbi:MAG: DnaJ domain-containing protein [Anaerovoracaceae bacterium]|jgi:GGDEF domain-containing protein
MGNERVDYYKILQVHHDAAGEVIDAAYRCLSKKYHPDLNQGAGCHERMQEINIAYGIVGNEKKRQEYHREWIRNHSLHRGKIEPAWEIGKEEEDAASVLDDFFSATLNGRWEQAYEKLTRADMRNVPMEDFLEWRKAVSSLYKLGNYKISFFKKYKNCDYAGELYPKIMHFSVAVTEMEVMTEEIKEDTSQKYVAFDGSSWRVCLGYTDLKSSALKYKCLSHSLPKFDNQKALILALSKMDLLTGLPSLAGFVEQVDKEIHRSLRYGNALSLAIITVQACIDENQIPDESRSEACVSYVAENLSSNIRRTDILGRCDNSAFAILFTETAKEDADIALAKLLRGCEGDKHLKFRLDSYCTSIYKGNAEKIIATGLKRIKMKQRIQGTVFNHERGHF